MTARALLVALLAAPALAFLGECAIWYIRLLMNRKGRQNATPRSTNG